MGRKRIKVNRIKYTKCTSDYNGPRKYVYDVSNTGIVTFTKYAVETPENAQKHKKTTKIFSDKYLISEDGFTELVDTAFEFVTKCMKVDPSMNKDGFSGKLELMYDDGITKIVLNSVMRSDNFLLLAGTFKFKLDLMMNGDE